MVTTTNFLKITQQKRSVKEIMNTIKHKIGAKACKFHFVVDQIGLGPPPYLGTCTEVQLAPTDIDISSWVRMWHRRTEKQRFKILMLTTWPPHRSTLHGPATDPAPHIVDVLPPVEFYMEKELVSSEQLFTIEQTLRCPL